MIVPAKMPEYSDESTRLKTFGNWPQDHCKSAKEMAEAGFRHTGSRDTVHCYYCGGGLRKWEAEDNPLVEHARWWPKCGFILQKLGEEFVEIVQFLNSAGKIPISLDMVEKEMVLRDKFRNRQNEVAAVLGSPSECGSLTSRL